MANELVDFIRGELAKGKDLRFIEIELIKVGWRAEVVRAAMGEVDIKMLDRPIVMNQDKGEQYLGNVVQKIRDEVAAEKDIEATVSVYSKNQKKIETNEKQITRFVSLDYLSRILTGMRKYPIGIAAVLMAMIMSIGPTTAIYGEVAPMMKGIQQNVSEVIEKSYPNNLEIVISKGRLSTNVTEPFFINISQADLSTIMGKSTMANSGAKSKIRLMVIDTKAKPDDFERYQAVVLLTESRAVFYSQNGIQEQSFLNLPDIKITKSMVSGLVDKYINNNRLAGWIDIGLSMIPVLVFVALFINVWLNYILFGFVALIMSWANGLPTSFRDSIRFAAAAALFPVLFWEIGSLVPGVGSVFRALEPVSNLLILAIAYAGIVNLRNNQKRLWTD